MTKSKEREGLAENQNLSRINHGLYSERDEYAVGLCWGRFGTVDLQKGNLCSMTLSLLKDNNIVIFCSKRRKKLGIPLNMELMED